MQGDVMTTRTDYIAVAVVPDGYNGMLTTLHLCVDANDTLYAVHSMGFIPNYVLPPDLRSDNCWWCGVVAELCRCDDAAVANGWTHEEQHGLRLLKVTP